MTGEYILFCRGKIVGGIYDDRLLVKKAGAAEKLMPAATCDIPYEGAKEMPSADEVDRRELLTKLFTAMHDELPPPKAKRRSSGVGESPAKKKKRGCRGSRFD